MMETSGLQDTVRDIFNGLSVSYDSVLELATLFQDRYWKRFLLDEADLKEGLRVLDLACGTCLLERYLVGKNCEVVGVDLSEQMIRSGKSRGRMPYGRLVLADAESIPFEHESFDIVLSCYLPKYCRVETLAREIWRILRPGGRVLLYDFSRPRGVFGPVHAFYVYGVLRALGFVARFTLKGLESALEFLPRIIRESRWDDSLREVLPSSGFVGLGEKVLSGGVVTAFWATKRTASP